MTNQCPNCHEDLEGDGYKEVIHCPNAVIFMYADVEPDSNPIYCNFNNKE